MGSAGWEFPAVTARGLASLYSEPFVIPPISISYEEALQISFPLTHFETQIFKETWQLDSDGNNLAKGQSGRDEVCVTKYSQNIHPRIPKAAPQAAVFIGQVASAYTRERVLSQYSPRRFRTLLIRVNIRKYEAF